MTRQEQNQKNGLHPFLIPFIIILMGAPGSGKGTQAKQLAAYYHIPHIATGDLFREHMANETPLGKKAKGYIHSGQLVPDDLVLDMLKERVIQPDCRKGFLLDGVPRTIFQANALEQMIGKNTKLYVLNLEVPDDVIVRRAAGRLLCKKCNAIYNLEISPPKKAGVCDKCGGELYQRADDAPNVVLERLKVYRTQTQPVLDFYKRQGNIANFNGNQPPQVVYEELKKHFDQVSK